jgi:hypothetical protein
MPSVKPSARLRASAGEAGGLRRVGAQQRLAALQQLPHRLGSGGSIHRKTADEGIRRGTCNPESTTLAGYRDNHPAAIGCGWRRATAMASSSAVSTVEAGFGPMGASVVVVRLRYLETVLGSMLWRLEAFLTTLDTASYCLRCTGAAVKYLSPNFCWMARSKGNPSPSGTIQGSTSWKR